MSQTAPPEDLLLQDVMFVTRIRQDGWHYLKVRVPGNYGAETHGDMIHGETQWNVTFQKRGKGTHKLGNE